MKKKTNKKSIGLKPEVFFKPQIWKNRPKGRGILRNQRFLGHPNFTIWSKPNLSNKRKRNLQKLKDSINIISFVLFLLITMSIIISYEPDYNDMWSESQDKVSIIDEFYKNKGIEILWRGLLDQNKKEMLSILTHKNYEPYNEINGLFNDLDENEKRNMLKIISESSVESYIKEYLLSLWESLNFENKQKMFDLMDEEKRLKLWNDGLLVKDRYNQFIFNSETNKKRTEFLQKLSAEQQTEMIKLIMKKNGFNGELKGLDKTKTNEIFYSGSIDKSEKVILTDSNGGKHIIPLYNLPSSLKEIKLVESDGKTRVQATIETGSGTDKKTTLIFLEEGHYLQKRIKKDKEISNQVDVIKTDGSYLSTLDYDDSKNAVFLVGTPKGGNLGDPKKGVHIWAEGHYDGTGASIIKYDKDGNWVYSVFPNPRGAKDDSGRNYAFVDVLKENVYNVYGNFLEQGGFGAVVYKTYDGVLDFSVESYNGENVLHVIKKGEDNNAKWNIKAEEGIVGNVVFKVKGIGNKDEFVYNQESGWVPRAGRISSHNQRVGSGNGPVSSNTANRADETRSELSNDIDTSTSPASDIVANTPSSTTRTTTAGTQLRIIEANDISNIVSQLYPNYNFEYWNIKDGWNYYRDRGGLDQPGNFLAIKDGNIWESGTGDKGTWTKVYPKTQQQAQQQYSSAQSYSSAPSCSGDSCGRLFFPRLRRR